jgi:DNA helicase-2/ATP-dependent DNA helicase PcrA
MPGGPLAGPLAEVVAAYRDLLAVRGEVDFDGLLAGALAMLRDDGDRRRAWQCRFSHVLVDEYQDVDGTQVELVALLAEPERNLFVVGDDDQTIYAWRLADVRRILAFPDRYPDAVRIVLETNYRCPPGVVTAADRLIARNAERVPKRLRAAPNGRPAASGTPVILTWRLQGPEAVDRLAAALPAWCRAHGRLAVLARTRSELGPILLALLRDGIPHATTVRAAIESEAVTALLDDLRAGHPGASPFPALLHARAARGWRRGDTSDALGEDAHAALDAAAGWAIDHRRVGDYLAACAAAARRLAELRDPRAPIEVTTVHGSKGREWPVVVILGFEADRFPNGRALEDALDPVRALEEERRLAYVAVTRCTERLVLAFDPHRASPFVEELMGRTTRRPAYRPTAAATVSR